MVKTYLIKYTVYDGSEWKHESLVKEITIEESELKTWISNFAGIQDNYDEIVIDAIAEKNSFGGFGGFIYLHPDNYM